MLRYYSRYGLVLGSIFFLSSRLLAAPVLRVEETTYRFGKTTKDKPIEHAFVIGNKGDSPLTLRVDSHCVCTTVTLSKTSIPPGETGEVRMVMDPTELSGRVNKFAGLATNDPRQRMLGLAFSGTVVADLRVEPQIYLGTINQKDVADMEKTLVIYSASRKFKIEKIEVRPQDLQVRVEPLNTTAGYVIWLTFKQTPLIGAYQGELVVYSDHPESPTRVSVGGVVEGSIAIKPVVVGFRGDALREPQQVQISRETKGLKINKVVPHFEGIDYTLKEADSSYILELRMKNPDAPAAQMLGSVELYTNDPENPVLLIPIKRLGPAPKTQ